MKLYDVRVTGGELKMDAAVVEAFRAVLTDKSLDKSFVAAAMSVPGEGEMVEALNTADPDAVHAVRDFVTTSLAEGLRAELEAAVAANTAPAYSNDSTARAQRSLKNTALAYLAKLKAPELVADAVARYHAADNMTDQVAAMSAVCAVDCPDRATVLDAFYAQWKADPNVMNKWFSIQAMSNLPGNVEKVKALLEHPAFDIKNPNKVYSLVGGLCASSVNFHNSDGSGYAFLGDLIVKLDALNPQVAARMVKPFTRWRKYDATRQELMKGELAKILAASTVSENTFEIASKSLPTADE